MATAKVTANERNTRSGEYMVHALSLMQAVPKTATSFLRYRNPVSHQPRNYFPATMIEQKSDQSGS
jgi:hypothetical protein